MNYSQEIRRETRALSSATDAALSAWHTFVMLIVFVGFALTGAVIGTGIVLLMVVFGRLS